MEVYFQRPFSFDPRSTLSHANKHSITNSLACRTISKNEASLNAYDIGGERPDEEIYGAIFGRHYYNYGYRKAFQECRAYNRFRLEKRIGGGAFGNIYAGEYNLKKVIFL